MEPYIFAFIGNREVRNRKAVFDSLLDYLEYECFQYNNFSDLWYPVFYCGGYGEFSQIVSEVIDLARKRNPDFYTEKLLIVPYNTPSYLKTLEYVKDFYDELVYPPLERVPMRYAIVRRNEWMIDQCNKLVVHMWNPISNTGKFVQYAKRKNKEILYIK